MAADDIAFTPSVTFLSQVDRLRIHDAVLEVLEATGMTVQHPEALELLKAAGCPVEGDQVRISRRLVEEALQTAPRSIRVYDREGGLAMDLGGRRGYYGTGSDLMHRLDGATGERRRTTLEDIRSAARLCDALPNIDFLMSFAHPHEVDPALCYVESFRAMVESSTKPIVNTADSRQDLAAMWEMAKILRGGEAALRQKPYWIQYDEPISPLKHPFKSVDKLLFCAATGMPVIYSPAPIAGSTAPMTVAGHVVQGLAECFCGLVIHQLTAPGAPFLMGVGPAVLDMVTSQCSYNAPEYLLSLMAMVEMSKHYDIPNWGYAGTSDSQIPDAQAGYEGGLVTFLSALAGSNLNHDVGYLDFGLTGCLEWVVIMDEIIDQIRRLQRGIPVNPETMAVPVIAEGGRRGQFLTHPHSLRHVRAVQWRPKLMNRQGYDRWAAAGAPTLVDKAAARVRQILDTHRPRPIEAGQARAIADLVQSFGA